jgi:hypothetical protein
MVIHPNKQNESHGDKSAESGGCANIYKVSLAVSFAHRDGRMVLHYSGGR